MKVQTVSRLNFSSTRQEPEPVRIAVFFFLLSLNLSAGEIPEPIRKSSATFEGERQQVKNYKVVQDILSETRVGGGIQVEKRKQIGYFVAPNRFFFFPKEKWINNVPVPTKPNEMEKSLREELEWISQKGLQKYEFSLLEEGLNHWHYSVAPKSEFPGASRGELWIQKENGKILRIFKEPIKKKEGIELFKTEVYFDYNIKYQEPSFTRLHAIVIENKQRIETKVEVVFSKYEFNVDLQKNLTQ